MGPDRGKQSPVLREMLRFTLDSSIQLSDSLCIPGFHLEWFKFAVTKFVINRSWTNNCNLRYLQGHINERRGSGSWMHCIDIFILIYSKHCFPYIKCGDNIEGNTHMPFNTRFSLSFSHVESGTWFPSFLATRSGQMTVFWPIQHWQRSRGLPFVPFLSLCLKHVKCFWAMNMKTIQKMVKQKGEGSVYFWQLHGAADLHTYLSQCFWSRMYS